MDKIESKVRDGDEAARIVNSPLFNQAFEDVRQTYIKALELIPTTEEGDDQAKDVRRKLSALATVRDALTKRIDTAKLAQHELSLREKAARGLRGLVKNVHNSAGDR